MAIRTFRCQACQGVYDDSMPDGTLYFHVCPLTRVTGIGPLRSVDPIGGRRDENVVETGSLFERQGLVERTSVAQRTPGAGRVVGVRVPIVEL